MDTGDAPSSFEAGTDGGFYAGQTPTDAGVSREVGGPPGWLVLLGSAVLTAALVGGGLWWLGPRPSDAPAPVSVAAPAPEAPLAAIALDEGLRALARANAREHARHLPWAERHELLQQLSAGPHAGRVDRRLHLALDLLQAGQAEVPCEAFADALDQVQAASDPYFADVLQSARAPATVCPELDGRREALHHSLVAPGEEPVGEADDVSESSPQDRDRRRSSRHHRKTKRPESSKKPTSQPSTKPTNTAGDTAGSNVGGKLDDELRPFGK